MVPSARPRPSGPPRRRGAASVSYTHLIDDIKAKQEALSHVFEKMYQAASAAQAAGAQQPGPDAGANNNQQKPNDDGVVDADFKEV